MSISIQRLLFLILLQVFTLIRFVLSTEKLLLDVFPSNLASSHNQFTGLDKIDCDASSLVYSSVGYSSSNQVYTQQNSPPSSSVTIEFDVVAFNNSTESFYVTILGSTKSYPITSFAAISDEMTCPSTMNFSKLIKGVMRVPGGSSISSTLYFYDYTKFGIYYLRIFSNLCHPSCLECDGYSPNKCIKCDTIAIRQSLTCTCSDPSHLFQEGMCVSSCSTFHFPVGKLCIYIASCFSADATGYCTRCYSPYIATHGGCALECTHLQMYNTTLAACEDNYQSETVISTEYLVTLWQDKFSTQLLLDNQLTVSVTQGLSNDLGTISLCGDMQVLLGYIIGGKMSKFYTPELNISDQFVMCSFKYIIIDGANDLNIKIVVNFADQDEIIDIPATLKQITNKCGRGISDIIGVYQKIIKLPHSSGGSTKVALTVSNTSGSDIVSLGIRELYILGMSCCDYCSSCVFSMCYACEDGYVLDTNYICQPCTNGIVISGVCEPCATDCEICTGTLVSQCTKCISGTQQIYDYSCQPCEVGYFQSGSSGTCEQCDSNCVQCQTSSTHCILCKSDQFLLNNTCVECLDEYSLYLSGSNCSACHTTCKTCHGSNFYDCNTCKTKEYLSIGNQCIACPDLSCETCVNPGTCQKCSGALKIKQGVCAFCNTNDGWYIQGEVCMKCHDSCKTCSGGSNPENCTSCTTGYAQLEGSSICNTCPITDEFNSSSTGCSSCNTRCNKCSVLNANFGYTNTDYCTYCYCTKCMNDHFSFLGECVKTCNGVGDGIIKNIAKQTCECRSDVPVLVQIQDKYFCTNEVPFGYHCESSSSPCKLCKTNCEVCASSTTCQQCVSGYYMWNGECVSECYTQLSIYKNVFSRVCECADGTYFKQRDISDITSYLTSELYGCYGPLKLINIEVINALSKPSYREGIPDEIVNNYFILTYNRKPLKVEYDTFNFFVMKDTLVKGVNYKIINTTLQGSKNSILVEVELVQNCRVTNISVQIDTLNDKLWLSNVILVSQSQSETLGKGASQSVTSGMEAMASGLTNSDSEVVSSLISYSKYFQLVCSLSNFVQLLTPIYFLNAALPSLIKFGSLLGAAFIFNQIPSQQAVGFKSESQTQRMLLFGQYTPRTLSEQSSQDTADSLSNMLAGFGLTSNIFQYAIGVHVMVFASVSLMIFCYVGRRVFKGKQYTMLLVDKISNFITSQLQSSITLVLCLIGYCLSTGEGAGIASIYLVLYASIYIQVAYLTFFKTTEYLQENIPNFFVDLNYKLKGAKYYLFISFFKKHLAIILFLCCYTKPMFCCIAISILFLSSAVIFAYFRFFSNMIVTVAKIIQELAIFYLFGLMAYIVHQYKEVIESDTVSDDALTKSLKLANIALISLLVCIIFSFMFSTYRLGCLIKDIVDAWKKYKEAKNFNVFDESSAKESLIQLQENVNSMAKAKVKSLVIGEYTLRDQRNKIESMSKPKQTVTSENTVENQNPEIS